MNWSQSDTIWIYMSCKQVIKVYPPLISKLCSHSMIMMVVITTKLVMLMSMGIQYMVCIVLDWVNTGVWCSNLSRVWNFVFHHCVSSYSLLHSLTFGGLVLPWIRTHRKKEIYKPWKLVTFPRIKQTLENCSEI
jgi:hypothetical protein